MKKSFLGLCRSGGAYISIAVLAFLYVCALTLVGLARGISTVHTESFRSLLAVREAIV